MRSYIRKKLGIPINLKNQISSDKIDIELLENLLEIFISKHVLCKTCNNPETDSKTFVCRACGSCN
jgi:translation initiation factor 2 beta subunit (eIF-2beta)/eIF-5